MPVKTFRKKPVEVDALQWTGTQERADELWDWTMSVPTTKGQFVVLDTQYGMSALGIRDGKLVASRLLEEGYTAAVYDHTHSAWLGTHTDDWIIKGFKNEFYPCAPDDFMTIYEPVTVTA